jgi:hypothetical protein
LRLGRHGWQDWDLEFTQPNGHPLDKHSDYKAWCNRRRRRRAAHWRASIAHDDALRGGKA